MDDARMRLGVYRSVWSLSAVLLDFRVLRGMCGTDCTDKMGFMILILKQMCYEILMTLMMIHIKLEEINEYSFSTFAFFAKLALIILYRSKLSSCKNKFHHGEWRGYSEYILQSAKTYGLNNHNHVLVIEKQCLFQNS